MSKMNCIDKKRFNSFLIYIFAASLLLCSCASKSSVAMNTASEDAAQTDIEHGNIDTSADESISADESADKTAENTVTKDVSLENKTEEKEYTESEPRIFLKPTDSKLHEVLGIDFSMMPRGKSRLTVTTDKKIDYKLENVDRNTFSLNINDCKIGELLLKDIDTTEFQTAVEMIRPVYNKDKKKVYLGIDMREVVTFHIKQTENRLTMDFDKIMTPVAGKDIKPLKLVEAETRNLSAERSAYMPVAGNSTSSQYGQEKYKGKRIPSLDFADADVTHILQLLNEVSKENIIWDSSIKGKKVSMILKDVQWDKALDLILMNNGLAKRYVGENIIWIATKQKMAQTLAEEEAEAQKLEQKLEQERLKYEEQKKRAQDLAPLITEPLRIDFAKASDIKNHIIVSKRGTISIDERTNTVIMTDTVESIEAAKDIIRQFDTPVKQIMIEARIVDASESFSRDLGVQWNNTTSAWSVNQNVEYTLPADATDFEYMGQRAVGGTFSTNTPDGWVSNAAFNLAKVTSDGLGSITLDASLAIAESEGIAKVMSAPKVIAREGASATISSGDKIIIPATENVASTTLDATLSLTVTPTSVSYNDYITLEVNVTDDQAPSTTRILQKEIDTTLMVKSGETVVIGGIIKESDGDDVSGVPGLKDVPGLGWLFKAKSRRYSKSELLIFLTPTVIPSPVKQF